MVFVHARKETVNTAKKLKEQAIEEGMSTFFEPTDHPKCGLYRRELGTSRNKEMKELFDAGFGIHHAGMLRSDRSMMERMFEDQAIKVCLEVLVRAKRKGPLLYFNIGLGCQFARTCCGDQGNSSV
jgi:replicative superfamily II helicase